VQVDVERAIASRELPAGAGVRRLNMPPAESAASADTAPVPAGDERAPGPPLTPWMSTAAAAALHASVLFMGSRAAATPPGEARHEALLELQRYLAAAEQRTEAFDRVTLEGQRRVDNRLAEGQHGEGTGGDDQRPRGTEKKAGAGDLSPAGTGAGSGKKGKGAGALPPLKQSHGRLPPEVIQRVVRQNFGRIRLCVENARSPAWAFMGRASVRFVIDWRGAVVSAKVVNTNVWDGELLGCVLQAFRSLHFPKPEGGMVTVIYPVSLWPDG
jgi:hypothetical protein